MAMRSNVKKPGLPGSSSGGLCPRVNLVVMVLCSTLMVCWRGFSVTWDLQMELDAREGELDKEIFDLETEAKAAYKAAQAERIARREEIAEKKRKDEEGLMLASKKRAKERAVRRREQKEEYQRADKDTAREAKALGEKHGGAGGGAGAGAREEDEELDGQEAVRRRHQQEPKPTGPGAGGIYTAGPWSSKAPRPCDTWANGPFAGKANSSITKAVWIANHGNNTASQWKRQKEGITNGHWKIFQGLRYHHQASLARLPSGAVLAAWQAAEDTEGEPDQEIRLSVSRDGVKGWKQSWTLNVTRAAGGAQWSPVPHVDAQGNLHIFFTESEGDCRRKAKPKPKWAPGGSIKMTTCLDAVPSPTSVWTEPRTIYGIEEDSWIPKQLSNHLIVLKSGEWVLPFWRENTLLAKATWPDSKEHCRTKDNPAGQKYTNVAIPFASILVSTDGGSTWESRGRLMDAAYPDEGDWSLATKTTWLIENSVVQLSNGDLRMYFRTSAGFVYDAISKDKGLTWTEPIPTSIQNPDSKSQVIRLEPDGPLLMAFNDHKKTSLTDSNGKQVKLPSKCLTVLSLAISEDDGESWRRIGVLRGGTAPGLRFHYPYMIQMGCKVLVAYSKFYVTGFKYQENDRELGIRAVHVHI